MVFDNIESLIYLFVLDMETDVPQVPARKKKPRGAAQNKFLPTVLDIYGSEDDIDLEVELVAALVAVKKKGGEGE